MGIRTCFANDGPAAAASSAAVLIRTLFMVAPPRAAIARPGGDGRSADKRLRLARPSRAKLGAPYALASTIVNGAVPGATDERRVGESTVEQASPTSERLLAARRFLPWQRCLGMNSFTHAT